MAPQETQYKRINTAKPLKLPVQIRDIKYRLNLRECVVGPAGISCGNDFNDLNWLTRISAFIDGKGIFRTLADRSPWPRGGRADTINGQRLAGEQSQATATTDDVHDSHPPEIR
jgi:hypothetical protein